MEDEIDDFGYAKPEREVYRTYDLNSNWSDVAIQQRVAYRSMMAELWRQSLRPRGALTSTDTWLDMSTDQQWLATPRHEEPEKPKVSSFRAKKKPNHLHFEDYKPYKRKRFI